MARRTASTGQRHRGAQTCRRDIAARASGCDEVKRANTKGEGERQPPKSRPQLYRKPCYTATTNFGNGKIRDTNETWDHKQQALETLTTHTSPRTKTPSAQPTKRTTHTTFPPLLFSSHRRARFPGASAPSPSRSQPSPRPRAACSPRTSGSTTCPRPTRSTPSNRSSRKGFRAAGAASTGTAA